MLLNLLNEFRKIDKNVWLAEHIVTFFAPLLINSILQELAR